MPKRERRIKEALIEACHRKLDDAILHAPLHTRSRLYKPSELAKSFDSLRHYAWRGIKYTEDGQEIAQEGSYKKNSVNHVRALESENKVHDLSQKYPDLWGKRGGAKQIAYHEKIHPDTVRRYMRTYLGNK
jgi:hypothetical protein